MPRPNRTIDEHRERAERLALRSTKLVVAPVALDKVAVRTGRRRALTSGEIDAFCRALDAPATFEVSCGIVGVPSRTMRDWISKGESEDETDPLLIELAAKYNAVMGGGNRHALMKLNIEHALDDPKTAKWLTEMLMPGGNVAKNMKVDVAVDVRPHARIPYELATPDEQRILEAAERIVERLKSLA